ncbi:Glycosyl transferase [Macleaya cordata]|uniref:Hexosyltransferase n=1 Tax=Macleaya cordata TaxID=56857 RepID=A0A200Q515_MACCD|nr:Glycosyl transferase [Macleaya cordata]
MGSKSGPKPKFFTLSLFFLALSLLLLISTFRLKTRVIIVDRYRENNYNSTPVVVVVDRYRENEYNSSVESPRINIVQKKPLPPLINFLKKEFGGNKEIKIGLVNIQHEDDHQQNEYYWKALGETVLVDFERVSNEKVWKDFFPEWIDEEEKNGTPPKCPEIPMPRFEEYREFDVVISRVPCGNIGTDDDDDDDDDKGKGIRDLFRLQVNLVVANLVARRSTDENDRPVYVVFMGYCGPMLEIFRCDDLVKREGQFWIYKPDLRRLKQKVQMPIGTCQLATPFVNQGEGNNINYNFSKLGNPIDHPREAYVTVLHSSEAYVCGAIALSQSIIQSNSTKDLILLADNSITNKSRQALEDAGWKVKLIDRIQSPHAKKGAYNEWNYSKLRIWQLTEYDKVIFIDSDLIIVKNIDDFFAYPQLSAAGNDNMIFNSGIMVIEPSKCMFESLMKKRHTLYSYNGGDQGFLNEVFTWWHRWPRRLNYLKLFISKKNSQYRPEVPEPIYAIHYLGLKPWVCYRDYDCNWDMLDHHQFASDSAHRRWWQVYDAMPERLQKYCGLSKSMDARIKKWRNIAKNASLPDEHWKIKVTDPRQTHLIN